jgi:HlyD family secretion protein
MLLRGWARPTPRWPRAVRIATMRGEFVNDVAAQPQSSLPWADAVCAGAGHRRARREGRRHVLGEVVATLDSPALRTSTTRARDARSLTVDLKRQEIEVRRQILQSQQTSDMAGVAIRAAEREFARAQQAWEQRVISERDYQRARVELDEAKLTHHHAVETSGLEKEGLKFELQTRACSASASNCWSLTSAACRGTCSARPWTAWSATSR